MSKSMKPQKTSRGFMGKKPRELDELEQALRRIAQELKVLLPEDVGYTLFLYTVGVGGHVSYMSTAPRAQMLRMLLDFCDRSIDGEIPERRVSLDDA